MLYKDWSAEWLELYVKPSAKARTYEKYCRTEEKYLLPVFGGDELDGLTAVKLQRYFAALTQKGLAAGTVNGILAVLKASLKKAVALGIADRQYTDAVVRPKKREKRIECFTKAEQKKMENYILEQHSSQLFGIVLTLYTGLRIGELLALTWDDIDFQKGTVTVSKSCYDSWEDGRYKKIFDTPKTPGSNRLLPVPRQILSRLRELKRHADSKFVVDGKSEYGAQVRSYQRTFERLLNRLHIGHKGFHSLRHTFATRALEVGMDVKTLSEILGHRDPTVTLQRYAHSLLEHKKEMMNKVGRLFGDK